MGNAVLSREDEVAGSFLAQPASALSARIGSLFSRPASTGDRPVLDPSVARVVRFSVFELDLRDGELRKSGVRLNLPDQLFQLLTTLLERPGELVSQDELRQRLWP